MEKLVQRYDNNNDSDDVRAKIYDYKNQSDPKNTLASIWSAMYQDIANINSLLTYLETNGHYITTEGYWEMIKGEALGLRAFHYFDLLRIRRLRLFLSGINLTRIKLLPWQQMNWHIKF